MTIIVLHKAQVYTDTLNRNDDGLYTYGEKYYQINKHFGFGYSGPNIPQRKFQAVVDMFTETIQRYRDNVNLDKLDFSSEIPASDFQLLLIADTLVLKVTVEGNAASDISEHSIYDDVAIGSGRDVASLIFNLVNSPKMFGIKQPSFAKLFAGLIETPELCGCGGEVMVYTPGKYLP